MITYAVQLYALPKAVYVWVGAAGQPATLASLAAAVPPATGSREHAPTSTPLLGDRGIDSSSAARLSRALGCMVFVTFGAGGAEGDGEEPPPDDVLRIEREVVDVVRKSREV